MLWVGFGIALVGAVGAIEYFRQIPTQVVARTLELDLGGTSSPAEVSVLVVGDTGMGDENQARVAQLMERLCTTHSTHAVLLLGDNFYYDGVADTKDAQWESKFSSAYSGPCLRRTPFYAVLGNHDYAGNPGAQIEYMRRPDRDVRWNLPARVYTLRAGAVVEFFASDTNFPERCGLAFLCSIDWLRERMASSHARWRVLLGHHPLHSAGKYQKPRALAARNLPWLYCLGQADLYLAGHDHNFQHIHAPFGTSPCSIEQVVVGTGGAPLNDVTANPVGLRFARKAYGVMRITFGFSEARFAFHTTDGAGKAVYSYELSKTEARRDP